jgi:hypothetical protein
MSSKITRKILQTIEDGVNSRPSAIEFEMLTRHASLSTGSGLRSSTRNSSSFPQTKPAKPACSCSTLQRLETVDRRFQERSRLGEWTCAKAEPALAAADGIRRGSHG